VTVVIPAWGSYASLVPRAVASVTGQDTPGRVVVVDNASERPIEAPSGAEVVRCGTRLTHGGARNLGLSRVATEFVVFLDADDYLLPGALGRLLGEIEARPDAPAVVARIVDASGALYRSPRGLAFALARWRRLFAWANATWSLMPTQGCTIMRTAAVREAGGYGDASSGEDWMLGARLAFGGRIGFDVRPALVYRSRDDSPGAVRASRRTMTENAALVRARLRDDGTVGVLGLALLALLQTFAVLVAHPLAITLRRERRGGARGAATWPRRAARPPRPGVRRAPSRATASPPPRSTHG
jgi:glycosyltransferase involved in cell wall biosynthesis